MARNQVWDSKGNLIEDIEIADDVVEPTVEEVLADLIQCLADKGVIY